MWIALLPTPSPLGNSPEGYDLILRLHKAALRSAANYTITIAAKRSVNPNSVRG
jgi:hypothetical protein